MATYSSRGPTRYDLVLKPDLVAPGSHVVSAEAPGSYLAVNYPQRHVAGSGERRLHPAVGHEHGGGGGERRGGAAAGGARRTCGRADVKAALQLTSTFMPSAGLVAAGAGSVNALAAAEFVRARVPRRLPTTTIAGETGHGREAWFPR